MFSRLTLAVGSLALTTLPASAHHPLGGETPGNFVDGLLSGIGHPIVGIDHLAFVIAVGIAATFTARPILMPLAFVIATMAGTLLHLASIGLPLVEVIIAASVATLGALLLSGRSVPTGLFAAIFAFAGLFHGHAYGEAVFGAEATPVIAYLLGFGLVQWAIAVGAGLVLGRGSRLATGMTDATARLSGAMIAGAGVLLLSDHALALIGLG